MMPILAALTSALLFGAAAPFSKILLREMSAIQLAGILYLGAALGASLLLFARKETLGLGRRMDRPNGWRLGLAILSGGVLGPLFLLKGLQIASAGSVSLWLILEMVLTALLGHFFFRDSLGKWGWIGASGCLAGSLLLSIDQGAAGARAGAWVALACLSWGLDNHLTALIDGLKPLQTTFWKGLVAGSVNLFLGFSLVEFHSGWITVTSGLVLGALSYGASIALYILSAQSLGATRSQMIFSSAPFFGLLLSFLLLREQPTWSQGSASVLFAGSLFLLFRDHHSHWHEHQSVEHVHGHSHDDGHHNHPHPGQPPAFFHSHRHLHDPLAHAHPHWPDIHHRHSHGDGGKN